MNILLIGGSNSLCNRLIIKLKKEGHRIYLLTGSRYSTQKYERVFERYDLEYDNNQMTELFRSASPDVTIYMGAYDSNYDWKDGSKDSAYYIAGLMNILNAYASTGMGKFIYLSSEQCYRGDSGDSVITEDTPINANEYRGSSIAMGENLCNNFRDNRSLTVITLRLSGYFYVPKNITEVDNVVAQMCLDGLKNHEIKVSKNVVFSLIYESDAVQFIWQAVNANEYKHHLYQISYNNSVAEEELARIIQKKFDEVQEEKSIKEEDRISIRISHTMGADRKSYALSNERFKSEFGMNRFTALEDTVKNIVAEMIEHPEKFEAEFQEAVPFWQRFLRAVKRGVLISAPYVESIVTCIAATLLTVYFGDTVFLNRLDLFLLYVILFALVYGQMQATFAGILSIIGFLYWQAQSRDIFAVLIYPGTYIWISMIFIVGLTVGHARDLYLKTRNEYREDHENMARQIGDIQTINDTNVHIKDSLQVQLLNQENSTGMIYEVTSTLDQMSHDEVLFYALEVLKKLIGSDDVAIYRASNRSYARLFSASSPLARTFGRSLKFDELGQLYEDISNHKVYINRTLEPNYPMMAAAIYDGDDIKLILMIWKLPWEKMTLGQANQLIIIGSLISNSALRADRYLDSVHTQTSDGSDSLMLNDAFRRLFDIYKNAEMRSLTDFSLLKVTPNDESREELTNRLVKNIRQDDYVGEIDSDDNVYIILTNTDDEGAAFTVKKLAERGFDAVQVHELPV